MTKPTPAPWYVCQFGFIRKTPEPVKGEIAIAEIMQHKREVGQANAAHVVRCVNAFDQLKAATEAMYKATPQPTLDQMKALSELIRLAGING